MNKNKIKNTVDALETLSEALSVEVNEIVDLVDDSNLSAHIKVAGQQEYSAFIKNIKQYCKNIESYTEDVYAVFENLNAVDSSDNIDKLTNENEILKQLLSGLLTGMDKVYYKIRYGIEL